MTTLRDFFELKTVQGTAVHTPHYTLIPESQALTIRFPFGGFVWQRPTAVLIEQGEQTERQPIVDVTRQATWGLLVASLLIPIILRPLIRHK